MERISERKIILVKRKSRLNDLIVRFNSISQARFYIEHLGADFEDYLKEHEEYEAAISQAENILQNCGRVQALDRSFLPNFIFGKDDIVVSIGQDGLVANTLKYLNGQPLIGINPSPNRWDGVLLPFKVTDLAKVIPEVVRNKRPRKEVSMAMAKMNGGQSILAVNDLFIGQKSHVSARYQIKYGKNTESHSSSGIIISTGLGSTGWMKSVLTGSMSIVNKLSNKKMAINNNEKFEWSSNYLYFSVREPFPSNTTGTEIIFGKISDERPLTVESKMAENGIIFSDGIEKDFLEFNSGSSVNITVSDRKGYLVL